MKRIKEILTSAIHHTRAAESDAWEAERRSTGVPPSVWVRIL